MNTPHTEHRLVTIVITFIAALFSGGCEAIKVHGPGEGYVAEETVYVSVKNGSTSTFYELNDSEKKTPTFVVQPDSYALLKVLSEDQSYDAMISPNSPASGVTSFVIALIDGSDPLVEDNGTGIAVKVTNGFAIFRGSWPVGTTDTVGGSAEGTTMVVQDNGPDGYDRVFLIEKVGSDCIKVRWKTGSNSFSLTNDERFVRYPAGSQGNDQLSGELGFTTEETKFIKYVKAKASVVGLPDD